MRPVERQLDLGIVEVRRAGRIGEPDRVLEQFLDRLQRLGRIALELLDPRSQLVGRLQQIADAQVEQRQLLVEEPETLEGSEVVDHALHRLQHVRETDVLEVEELVQTRLLHEQGARIGDVAPGHRELRAGRQGETRQGRLHRDRQDQVCETVEVHLTQRRGIGQRAIQLREGDAPIGARLGVRVLEGERERGCDRARAVGDADLHEVEQPRDRIDVSGIHLGRAGQRRVLDEEMVGERVVVERVLGRSVGAQRGEVDAKRDVQRDAAADAHLAGAADRAQWIQPDVEADRNRRRREHLRQRHIEGQQIGGRVVAHP